METGKMKLALSAGALALSMALAGCGGSSSSGGATSSGGGDTPTPSTVTLPNGVTAASLVAGRFSIDAGEEIVISNGLFSCEGDDACEVRISADGVVTNTGGELEVTVAPTDDDGMLVLDEDTHCGMGTKLNDAGSQCVADTDMADAKANTDKAKALRSTLIAGSAAVASNAEIPVIGATLRIPLKKTDDVIVPLGDWKGAHYAGEDAGTGEAKASGMRRVYSNKDDSKKVPFAGPAGGAIHGLTATPATDDGNAYVYIRAVDSDTDANDKHVEGSNWPDGGHTDYEEEDTVEGTFRGAPGTYECHDSDGCRATYTETGIQLTSGTGGDEDDDWTFTPSASAMLDDAADNYLNFGWWKREDSKGHATHARAFAGVVGDGYTLVNVATGGNAVLSGKATYNGRAAGLFAIVDGQNPADDRSGSFTAQAKLEAEFDSAASTLTGTINNFTLEDGGPSVNWSIELQKLSVNMVDFDVNSVMVQDSAGWFDSRSPGTAGDGADKGQTLWSINDAPDQENFGGWHARMYNAPAADAPDKNNRPDAVVGTFYSGYDNTHRLRGGFGAERAAD